MRRPAKTGISQNSHAADDKMRACLFYSVPMGGKNAEVRNYIAACGRWHADLSPDQRETVLVVLDCYAGPHRDAAEGIAANLPSAPKCPL
jgi:hypothetical protein